MGLDNLQAFFINQGDEDADKNTRECIQCGERKQISEFFKNGTYNGQPRIRRECKDCYKANKAYAEKLKERKMKHD